MEIPIFRKCNECGMVKSASNLYLKTLKFEPTQISRLHYQINQFNDKLVSVIAFKCSLQ